jgi:FKBP-type peptidyl-prolyl cis-trans isomerase
MSQQRNPLENPPSHLDIKGTGISIKILKSGDDRYFPSPHSTVSVHYEAFISTDLTKPLDSSRERNEPFVFTIGKGQTVCGFEVGVFNLSLGMMAEITVPFSAAYGEMGHEPIVPPQATLVYKIELIDFTDEQEDKTYDSSDIERV